MKKRLLSLLSLIVVVSILMAGGTAAYFTAEETARNVITAGSMDIKLHQISADGEDCSARGMQVMPGDTVSRILTVENTGEQPMYLRVKLTKGVEDAELTADECMELDIDKTAWTYQDGYYYYNEVLNANETTPALFTQIYFSGKNMDNSYLGKQFTLDVSVLAVQAKNNGATVWDAVGFPEG